MKVRWTKAARLDRELIYVHIERENLQAALDLDERLENRTVQLAELPNLGRPGRVAGTRELSISGSSYVLVYRVTTEVLWVVRVIHTSRAWPDERG